MSSKLFIAIAVISLFDCLSNAQLIEDEQVAYFSDGTLAEDYRLDQLRKYDPVPEAYPENRYRWRRDVFGGVNKLPGGGRTQTVGVQKGPAWGSLTQSFDRRGFSTPITYSGGLGHTSPAGHGISGSAAVIPGIGGQANIRGQLGIVNTPSHQVSAWGQHDRNLNKDLKAVGPPTNSGGINYLNKNNGAGAFVSGTHTPGFPSTGTVGASYPLVNHPNTKIEVTGQSTFGHGMKPDNQVGVQVTHDF